MIAVQALSPEMISFLTVTLILMALIARFDLSVAEPDSPGIVRSVRSVLGLASCNRGRE